MIGFMVCSEEIPNYGLVLPDNQAESKFATAFDHLRGRTLLLNFSNIDFSFGYASTGKSLAFTLWDDNEPNNSGNDENCVEVEGKWNDWACDNKARFVCEMPLPSFEVKMKEM